MKLRALIKELRSAFIPSSQPWKHGFEADYVIENEIIPPEVIVEMVEEQEVIAQIEREEAKVKRGLLVQQARERRKRNKEFYKRQAAEARARLCRQSGQYYDEVSESEYGLEME